MTTLEQIEEMEKTNPYGIITPKTVEEFRENLLKYYVCITNGDMDRTRLYIQEDRGRQIDINKIESFSDIYKILKMGFCGTNRNFNGGSSPHILPRIIVKKDIGEYMDETGQFMSCRGYFYDENNYSLHQCNKETYLEDHKHFMNNGMKYGWVTLDNQIWREFYGITLGKFSGYIFEDLSDLLEGE